LIQIAVLLEDSTMFCSTFFKLKALTIRSFKG